MHELHIESKEEAVFVVLKDEVTLEISAALRKEIEAALSDQDFNVVVVDMSAISLMDSSGIGLLVSLNTNLQAAGKKLFLLRPSFYVMKTLELVRLGQFFSIANDEEELAALFQDTAGSPNEASDAEEGETLEETLESLGDFAPDAPQ